MEKGAKKNNFEPISSPVWIPLPFPLASFKYKSCGSVKRINEHNHPVIPLNRQGFLSLWLLILTTAENPPFFGTFIPIQSIIKSWEIFKQEDPRKELPFLSLPLIGAEFHAVIRLWSNYTKPWRERWGRGTLILIMVLDFGRVDRTLLAICHLSFTLWIETRKWLTHFFKSDVLPENFRPPQKCSGDPSYHR